MATRLADDILGVFIGGLLAILGGLIAQLYQAHRNDLAAKRGAHMNVIRGCQLGISFAKDWVERLELTGTTDNQILIEIKRECSDLYKSTQIDLRSAGDSISGSLQNMVVDYCKKLYEIYWKDYGNQASGPLTTEMYLKLKADLESVISLGDVANKQLSEERSKLVDLRWLRQHHFHSSV